MQRPVDGIRKNAADRKLLRIPEGSADILAALVADALRQAVAFDGVERLLGDLPVQRPMAVAEEYIVRKFHIQPSVSAPSSRSPRPRASRSVRAFSTASSI